MCEKESQTLEHTSTTTLTSTYTIGIRRRQLFLLSPEFLFLFVASFGVLFLFTLTQNEWSYQTLAHISASFSR